MDEGVNQFASTEMHLWCTIYRRKNNLDAFIESHQFVEVTIYSLLLGYTSCIV